MVTLNDVAKVAGVSAKTVSRAVNGDREISDATRDNILRIATELEYVPHAQARRLASGKTRSIALHYPARQPATLLRTARDELRFRHRDGRGAGELLLHPLHRRALACELRRICKGSIADGLILMQVASRTGASTRCGSSTTRSR